MSSTLPDYVTDILKDDEKVLWTARQRRYMDEGRAVCLVIGIVLACLVAVVLACAGRAQSPESLFSALVFLAVMELICIICYVTRGRKLERTLMVLTGKRALIVEEPRKPGGLVTVLTKDVEPMMLIKHRRYRRGCADYVLATEKMGRTTRQIGFMRVPEAESPEAVLAQLGVVLPQRKEKRADCRVERPATSAVGVVARVLLVCGLGWFLSRAVETEGALLFLNGEKAMAQVLDFEQVQEEKGRRVKREVTVNYPILAFSPAEGATCVTMSLYGYENPPFDCGDRVEILYDPAFPRCATMNDRNILIAPGILLALLVWWGWTTYRYIVSWCLLRKMDILVLDMSGDEKK